jgi:hypothetical protein
LAATQEKPMKHRLRGRIALIISASFLVTACGSGSMGAGPPSTSATTPQPAGATPSASARMVCGPEAQREIALSLQLRSSAPTTPTWADQLYSCRYTYPVGSVEMSVKELADQAATDAYYTGTRTDPADQVALHGLGQAAYAGPDGIIVVRKDFKVLRIDATGLPAQFGQPPMSRAEAARRIASDIMTCWNGD